MAQSLWRSRGDIHWSDRRSLAHIPLLCYLIIVVPSLPGQFGWVDRKEVKAMAGQTHQSKPPNGLSRLLFRLPISLYNAGLGGLLGSHFLIVALEKREACIGVQLR